MARSGSFFLAAVFGSAVLAGLGRAAVEPPAEAPPAPTQLATLVRIHLPLSGSADLTLQATIRRIRDQLLTQARALKIENRPILVLQLEAAPGEAVAGDSQFERALAVAEFLSNREMAGVRTVAYLPRSLSGHGVLLALACEEIVMAPEATIGRASAEEPADEPIRQTIVSAYREVAEKQRTIPTALALGMIDPSLEVLQVESQSGTHFLLSEELDQFVLEQDLISQEVLVPAGTAAEFDGREGRRFGFVKYLATSRQALAAALGVEEQELIEDESLADEWRPVVIDLSGEITPQLASRIDSLLGQAVQQQQANWVCLRIDSAGGDLAAGLRIASSLARVDANSVRTIAYVPQEAAGVAAVVALSCHQLAMAPEAKLAALSARQLQQPDRQVPPPGAPRDEPPAAVAAAVETIRTSLAARVGRPWSLLAAMIDPRIELSEYQNNQTAEVRIMSDQEADALPDAANWQLRAALGDNQQRLSLTGAQAQEKAIAWRSVETIDELAQQFGLRGEIPHLEPNLALEFIEALAAPELAIILLMVGFAGIYIELKTPGLGMGGFVGAVALMLFFWSKYLNGTAGWLEALLFLSGFLFILLEIFVLPGFGVFGLGGGAMMIASLVLASLTFVTPHSQAELDQLARSIGTVSLAGVGMMTIVLATRRYLPQAPLFRNIVLAPPEDEEREELQRRETLFDSSALLGKTGTAFTDLRPSGKAVIEHELVDVIAEAEPLDKGTSIIVTETHGGRIVVRAAPHV